MEHVLTLRVDAPEGFSQERVRNLVEMLIDIGKADAIQTCNDGTDDIGDAQDALELGITIKTILPEK